MVDMNYSQVGLPRSHVQDEIRLPLQETMTNLEANMGELRRSQDQFMEEVNKPSQEESNFKSEVDELTFTMAKLAKCGVDLSIKEEMTPMATSYTPSKFEIHQLLQEKRMSVQEKVAKYMNEGENMVETSFKGQQKNLSFNLEVIKEEEDLSYNEYITSSNDKELEKLQRVENDAQ